ncbi:hypothetical protein XAP412_250025 [Xanthomonas phaseoli pv. phaseoli]|uniref:Uncharacterized protein n=1 Tax=Xanthomonas campestris pv. phaseoli TaxID=317013 RepID=A0AB38DYN8_XANCH|nr:hypothetical protein XAP6984_310110 [Xanthomonas phaseoli pv. phaseoli]SON82340.1 hypothetical protein XAP412_250025 [Xanthomonas phaseoli pv. phaseoli]SON86486.1 hypothetical protein XAP7430_260109 [Xanthomonas phaseoli pv. phaseoli]
MRGGAVSRAWCVGGRFDLSLPHVPEGIRRVLRAAGVSTRHRVSLDPWRAQALRIVERRAARFLRRLRHAIDV